jgi:zinc finger CCHC domain-containing protein 9
LLLKCPDNPRGLYPNGGACKNCSSVEHYARDCPEVQKNNLLTGTVYAKKLRTSGNFEVLSDDDDLKKNIKPKVLKNKVVKF